MCLFQRFSLGKNIILKSINMCGSISHHTKTKYCGNGDPSSFLAVMRCLEIFFAVLRCSEPPNVPLKTARLIDTTCLWLVEHESFAPFIFILFYCNDLAMQGLFWYLYFCKRVVVAEKTIIYCQLPSMTVHVKISSKVGIWQANMQHLKRNRMSRDQSGRSKWSRE